MDKIRKKDLNDPCINKSLKKLIGEYGYELYGKYIAIIKWLDRRKENSISDSNIEILCSDLGIPELEFPLLCFALESIYPPLVEVSEEQGTYTFTTTRKTKPKIKIDHNVIEVRLSEDERAKLLQDISEGELNCIIEEVHSWLEASTKGRKRESHYLTIRTFLRNKKEKGLIYTARHQNGAGYYPERVVKAINEQQ